MPAHLFQSDRDGKPGPLLHARGELVEKTEGTV